MQRVPSHSEEGPRGDGPAGGGARQKARPRPARPAAGAAERRGGAGGCGVGRAPARVELCVSFRSGSVSKIRASTGAAPRAWFGAERWTDAGGGAQGSLKRRAARGRGGRRLWGAAARRARAFGTRRRRLAGPARRAPAAAEVRQAWVFGGGDRGGLRLPAHVLGYQQWYQGPPAHGRGGGRAGAVWARTVFQGVAAARGCSKSLGHISVLLHAHRKDVGPA